MIEILMTAMLGIIVLLIALAVGTWLHFMVANAISAQSRAALEKSHLSDFEKGVVQGAQAGAAIFCQLALQ